MDEQRVKCITSKPEVQYTNGIYSVDYNTTLLPFGMKICKLMNKNSVLHFSESIQQKLSEENDCGSEEINEKTEL